MWHVVCLFPGSDDSAVGPHSTQLKNINRIPPCILGGRFAPPFTPTETLRAGLHYGGRSRMLGQDMVI